MKNTAPKYFQKYWVRTKIGVKWLFGQKYLNTKGAKINGCAKNGSVQLCSFQTHLLQKLKTPVLHKNLKTKNQNDITKTYIYNQIGCKIIFFLNLKL